MCKVDSDRASIQLLSWCEGGAAATEFILGIDLAKRKFDAALLANAKLRHKVFANSREGFSELIGWLKKYGVDHVHVCMEASSAYGEELATYLHDAGHKVSIVNPARIKGFAQSELLRTKNDKADAGVIARFCDRMRPEPWKPLSPEIRGLQALVRRVGALLVMRTQELNRMGATHETVVHSVKEHISFLDEKVDALKKEIADLIKKDPNLRAKSDLLRSIPGIGEATVAAILSELSLFENCDRVRRVVAYIGLAPREFTSGSSVKGKPRICKTGQARMRKALYMPSLASMQYNPVIIGFCRRLKKKEKNGKVIVCAVMRKLVHLIFGVLKSGRPFDPNFGLKTS
jgi:transposase